ncbi:Solute carrier family 35 member F2 [Liparis tanakae]|uniref:Solute carrier family 35 member F2 n=1 Tax=Liparis tanakae TaxID=230148 RepID=A0A4Z2H828_9TELE|nr:Solute carrier family 35 member F2 [Liparis tanakae]
MLFVLYGLCMYALYSFMPVVVKMTSATAVNLSLLTADLFSLFCGLFLFHYTFSALYIISFVVITAGFVMFNAAPMYSALPESGSGGDDPAEVFADLAADLPAESSSDRLLSAGGAAPRTESPAAAAALRPETEDGL